MVQGWCVTVMSFSVYIQYIFKCCREDWWKQQSSILQKSVFILPWGDFGHFPESVMLMHLMGHLSQIKSKQPRFNSHDQPFSPELKRRSCVLCQPSPGYYLHIHFCRLIPIFFVCFFLADGKQTILFLICDFYSTQLNSAYVASITTSLQLLMVDGNVLYSFFL